jgi:acetyl-CoA carboxylase carboxyl transferase subunit beta
METTTADWIACAGCGTPVYGRRYLRALRVCPDCTHHGRIPARDLLAALLDEGTFDELPAPSGPYDVLGFADTRPYPDRHRSAAARTGLPEAAVAGAATIAGIPVVVAALEFGFMGGSMGAGLGEIVTCAAEEAAASRRPFLIIAGSGGARMQEGCMSLMQMAKTSAAMDLLRELGVLTLCLVTDPTFGGVTASFVTQADVLLAEPGARMGFAGPQVIAKTVRERLPERFQTAEHMRAHGLVDLVVPRDRLRGTLGRLLRMYGTRGEPFPPVPFPRAVPRPREAWEVVRLARHPERPTTLDHLTRIFDDFEELHGDRLFADDPAIVGGPALLAGRPVMVIGHQKGHNTSERMTRNFGMPHPEGYRKALRLMDQAERLGLPLVTLVDTPGAYPGVQAEERGQAHAIAQCVQRMSGLRTPTVCVITGEGGSGGALALAVTDQVLIMENAFYSVISPEACSVILSGDPEQAPLMAERLKVTAPDLLELGIVDSIIAEPDGGAHADPQGAARALGAAVQSALAGLTTCSGQELVARRRQRFRAYGRSLAEVS